MTTIAPSRQGPVARTATPRRAALSERLLAAALAVACLAMLTTGALLDADPAGHGTHTSLGLAPCPWPVLFDKPCPTCGMTTAVTHAASAEPIQAILAQPFGALIALAAATAFWLAAATALTGIRLSPYASLLLRPTAMIVVAALFAAAWLFKMLTFSPA